MERDQWKNKYRIIKSENSHPSMILREFYAPNDVEAAKTLSKEKNMPIHMFSHLWLERVTEQANVSVKVEV